MNDLQILNPFRVLKTTLLLTTDCIGGYSYSSLSDLTNLFFTRYYVKNSE